MILGAIFTAMTIVALAFLLVPLLRRTAVTTKVATRADYDMAVYRDQLAEISHDVERGLLDTSQAEAAGIEIQRRVLAVADHPASATTAPRRSASNWVLAIAIAVILPLGAATMYLRLGSPGLPGQPFAARQAERANMTEAEADHMSGLVSKLAARLATDPSDTEGWIMLARSYQTLGRYADAADAYRKAIEHGRNTAETLANFGEMATLAGDGTISETARSAFLAAYRADNKEPRAQYYLGEAAAQDDHPQRAIAIWRDLVRNSAPGAPWLPTLKERIEGIAQELGIDPNTIEPSPPNAGDAAALPPSFQKPMNGFTNEQKTAIQAMVAQLAQSLTKTPDDFDGWMRLGKSYLALGQPVSAVEAYGNAVKLRPQDAAARAALVEATRQANP
ncbi:MAG: c-type cytochrome biogenesis protein CcmI [Alphaproteobacteria bacterium]|nr:c-type cytochrome biogenesis protein CcmI [Alphaproteobacteria bacterium]